jgi:hypothetical protein
MGRRKARPRWAVVHSGAGALIEHVRDRLAISPSAHRRRRCSEPARRCWRQRACGCHERS